MSASIKRLAPDVASKIAAGEVAERPFNVVKEVMENSVDAGASNITVEIADGGLSLVRIKDNGRGVSETDIPLTVERFATSKAVSVEDVYNAATFGFRGEALAAISSVSDFTFTSGVGDGTAYEIKSLFGKVSEVKPAPPITGTVVQALNLFENVPARRKFLKSFKSLENEIIKLVKHFSLINPGVEIKLICDGDEIFAVSSGEDTALRASKVFPGKGFYKGEAGYDGSKVFATATLPAQSDRLKRDAIVLGVNGRLIKDASLVQAVIRAYYRLIPDGKFPCAAVDIRLSPAEVDSNVHPSKMEVRFENPREIFALVCDAVANSFSGRGVNIASVYTKITGSSSIKFDDAPVTDEAELEFKGASDRILPPIPDDFDVFSVGRREVKSTVDFTAPKVDNKLAQSPFDGTLADICGKERDNAGETSSSIFGGDLSGKVLGVVDVGAVEATFESKIADGDFKIIGQIDDSYIVCETEDKRVLFIDQHAAHERILFEKNRTKNKSNAKATIVLHEPAAVDITDEILESLRDNESVFYGFGYAFSLKPVEMKAEITRIPYSSSRRDFRKEFIDIARDLCLSGVSKTEDAPRAMLSCKSAIKAGDPLTESEMEYLVRLLFSTDNFGTCPHGRPIVYSMSVAELARKFLR